jgi:hypothetical protein
MLRPLGYVAAGLVAVLAGWVALQNLPGPGTVTPPVAPPEESTPGPAENTAPVETPQVVTADPPAPRLEVSVPETTPVAPAVLPPAEPRQPRQMQFVTSRGTRVIWTLNPDFDLGSSPTSEQGDVS